MISNLKALTKEDRIQSKPSLYSLSKGEGKYSPPNPNLVKGFVKKRGAKKGETFGGFDPCIQTVQPPQK